MTTGELVRTESVVRPVRWRLAALRRAPMVPLGLIILLVLTALLANVLTPYSPVNISLPDRLRPPFWEQGEAWRIRWARTRWVGIYSPV